MCVGKRIKNSSAPYYLNEATQAVSRHQYHKAIEKLNRAVTEIEEQKESITKLLEEESKVGKKDSKTYAIEAVRTVYSNEFYAVKASSKEEARLIIESGKIEPDNECTFDAELEISKIEEKPLKNNKQVK